MQVDTLVLRRRITTLPLLYQIFSLYKLRHHENQSEPGPLALTEDFALLFDRRQPTMANTDGDFKSKQSRLLDFQPNNPPIASRRCQMNRAPSFRSIGKSTKHSVDSSAGTRFNQLSSKQRACLEESRLPKHSCVDRAFACGSKHNIVACMQLRSKTFRALQFLYHFQCFSPSTAEPCSSPLSTDDLGRNCGRSQCLTDGDGGLVVKTAGL